MIANHSPHLLHAQYLKVMGIQPWVRRTWPPLCTDRSPTYIDTPPLAHLPAPPEPILHTNTHAQLDAIPILTPTVSVTAISTTPPLTDASSAPISTLDWQSLKQCVAHCTTCELHQSRTQTVFGVGNPQAAWMLIGEAPGDAEDAQGEPFVDAAGQLLNAMLYALGLNRDTVYITNVVKCRPPNNRNPKTEEIGHCNSYLQRQIALINPQLIVALGAVATHHLLNTTVKISDLRGQRFDYQGIPLIPMYHPAYLIRRPIEKRKAWHDVQILSKTFAELSSTVTLPANDSPR